MVVVAGRGIPLGSHTASASPAEIRLLEKVMGDIRVPRKGPGRPRTRPKRVIGDKADDSDLHRKILRGRGINLHEPHVKNHWNPNRRDDRLRNRHGRRYIVERAFNRFGNIARQDVGYEYHSNMFVAVVEPACVIMTLRNYLSVMQPLIDDEENDLR
jgi:hypothetical protein